MSNLNEWIEFIKRANNFHWNSAQVKQLITEVENSYDFFSSINHSITELNKPNSQDRKLFLNNLFSKVYTAITMTDIQFTYFLNGAPLYDDVYNACFFTTLCMFLHETTRKEGKSLMKFIYDNSLDYYNDTNLEEFCPLDHPSDKLLNEAIALRKQRHRLLSSRPTYNKRSEWSAIAKDSEYEWCFKYTLEIEDETLKDTYKRIGNLYKDINNALREPRNDNFNEKINSAYKKFLSKLEKIKYENYLNLQRVILDYICENNEYYGINLYRVERTLRPYITTNEVNQLLICETDADKNAILAKSVMLSDICFPKVYKDFADLSYYPDIKKNALRFQNLCNCIIPINCLIIDELVENNYLGEDWYDFLCETINEIAKEIFYDPKDINYAFTPESQKSYIEILSAAVENLIFIKTGITFP